MGTKFGYVTWHVYLSLMYEKSVHIVIWSLTNFIFGPFPQYNFMLWITTDTFSEISIDGVYYLRCWAWTPAMPRDCSGVAWRTTCVTSWVAHAMTWRQHGGCCPKIGRSPTRWLRCSLRLRQRRIKRELLTLKCSPNISSLKFIRVLYYHSVFKQKVRMQHLNYF